MSDKKKTAINVLFPKEEVPLSDGSKITVTPLSLVDIPKVIKSFAPMIKKIGESKDNADLASLCASELINILPFCIDRKMEEIPFSKLPHILQLVIDQNVPDESLVKWRTLIGKFRAAKGVDQGK
jgi:hypothetical protein